MQQHFVAGTSMSDILLASRPTAVQPSSPSSTKEQAPSENLTKHACATEYSQYCQDHDELVTSVIDILGVHEKPSDTGTYQTSDTTTSEVPRNASNSMDPISLTDLAHLRRVQRYQRRKRNQAEQRLQVLRTSWIVRDRLIQNKRRLLDDLSKALRSENQKGFVPLFQAYHTTETACEDHDRTECPWPTDDRSRFSTKDSCVEPFLNQLPEASCAILTRFLLRLRNDPDFLLRHLSRLSNKQFDALLRYHLPHQPSVLRGDGVAHSLAYKERTDPRLLDAFLDFGRHDFLSLLLQVVGPDSNGELDESFVQYWAKTCATLISDQKPGAEKFFVAVLNAWPVPEEQTNFHILESWLLKVLREGDFLLEKPDKYSFRMRAQSRDGMSQGDSSFADAFFIRSMNSLLEILKDPSADIVPKVTLKLATAIVDRLRGSQHYQTAPYLLCAHWLFQSYLANLIRNPESFGLLLSFHISANSRRRILDEVALRLQKLAFDAAYTWQYSIPVNPILLGNMQGVVSLFRPSPADILETPSTLNTPPCASDSASHLITVTLCPSDMLTLVHGLFPESIPDLDMSVLSLGGSTVHSSASSVSGFSILKNHVPFEDGTPGYQQGAKVESGSPSLFEGHFGSRPIFFRTQPDYGGTTQERIEDDFLITQLRSVCSELTVTNASDTTSGHRDPFLEPWASILITRNGAGLSTHRPAPAFVDTLDVRTPEAGNEGIDISKLPSQIKSSVYSVLAQLEDGQSSSRRGLHHVPDLASPQPRTSSKASLSVSSSLLNALEVSMRNCQRKGFFAKAQSCLQALNRVKLMLRSDPQGVELIRFMNGLARTTQECIDEDRSSTDACNTLADEYKMSQDSQLSRIQVITKSLDRLREKMWYISSVRSAGHYEDLFRVTSALKTMGLSRKPVMEQGQPPLRRRPTVTGFHEGLHLKTESAILDFLAAPPGHGGPNKLSDTQTTLVSDWLQKQGVENVCRGEERLHRFCREVSRCVDYLVGDSIVDHPVLWSSDLFRELPPPFRHGHTCSTNAPTTTSARERLQAMYDPRQHQRPTSSLSYGRPGAMSPVSFGSPRLASDASFATFGRNAWGVSGSCSPTPTNATSETLWSSFTTGPQTASSMTSLPSQTFSRPLSDRSSYGSLATNQNHTYQLEELKHNVTGLLLSDLGQLFRQGSELDVALWDTFDGKFASRVSTTAFVEKPYREPLDLSHQMQTHRHDASNDLESEADPIHDSSDDLAFDPKETFRQLFNAFAFSPSPYEKLKKLYQIQETYQSILDAESLSLDDATKTTPTFRPVHDYFHDDAPQSATEQLSGARNDIYVAGFRRLLRDSSIRPRTLFRDLQYIAALVPTTILDSNTEEGDAFWNATIAALSIKQDITHMMIQTADAIVAYHTLTRGHSFVSSPAQAERDSATFATSRPSSATASENLSKYTMADAAQLYLIAAKEGDAVAQRELATLYLTHPEMMTRVIAPMTRAGDVFKGAAADASARGRKNSGLGVDKGGMDGKYDPVTMAIARHWMELAAKGGDELANNTLKATDEIERIPS